MSLFEAVIGLEVHCQLATRTKIFCACPASPPRGVSVADVPVNQATCPVCAGHPGTLPVLNRQAVDYAVRAGIALGCEIHPRSQFSRKNYFYPDLPKGYQITQFDSPVCGEGALAFSLPSGERRTVRIQRIHLEEDAGKSVHAGTHSEVNLNRAGVPLIEIVSHPEMRTAEEAGAYLRALHAVVTWIEVCDGNMQEGNFRCDANVSIRPVGATEFGTRVEVKNVNSFRFVEKAIAHEIERQTAILKSGGTVKQETRGYDPDRDATFSQRGKEEAHDYRYFPEPDLPELTLAQAWVDQIRSELPELPDQRRARYERELGLSHYDAGIVTSSRELVRYFEEAIQLGASAKAVANLLAGEVSRLANEKGTWLGSRLLPVHLADVVRELQAARISATAAKQLIGLAWDSGERIADLIELEGLAQVSDTRALEAWLDEVIAQSPSQWSEFQSGKDKLIGFFTGQVMKKSGGKANPALIQELIRKKVGS